MLNLCLKLDYSDISFSDTWKTPKRSGEKSVDR